MAKPIDIFKLPAGPAEICFDKNEFMKVSATAITTTLSGQK